MLALVLLLGGSAVAQEQQPGRLRAIESMKTVRIAYRTDARPFSFLSGQDQPMGYSIDLCKLVVLSLEKQLGGGELAIQWVPVTTETRFDAVASGKADMECGASTITLGRLKQVDFSSVIFVETTGVVAKAGIGIAKAADLAGRKLAVVAGTSNERALRNLQSHGILAGVTLQPVRDRAEGVAALQAGRVDGFASDKLLLAGADFQDHHKFLMLPDDLSFEAYAITLPRGDSDFRLAVNTGLAQVYRSGLAAQVFRKWFDAIGLKPVGAMQAVFHFGALPD
jgi:ABC-type amino acid transport substrate-binding protein